MTAGKFAHVSRLICFTRWLMLGLGCAVGWILGIGAGPTCSAAEELPLCVEDACESALGDYKRWLADGSPAERARALALLARLGTAESAALLAPIAAEPGNEQALALAGLAWTGDLRYADRWLAGLRSADPAVRQVCVWASGALMDASAQRPVLLMLQGAEPSAQVALLDAIGLARLSDLFLDVAAAGRSESKAVRAASLRALAGMPLAGAQLLWRDRLHAEKDAQVRRLAAAPLGPPRVLGASPLLNEGLSGEALAALAQDPGMPIGQRAEAAFRWAVGGAAGWSALKLDAAPAWVRRGGLLGRMVAGSILDTRQLEVHWRMAAVGRWAHPALRRASDDWILERAWGTSPRQFRYDGTDCPPELAPARE